MKKLFLSLFVMGSITFGLQSCKDSCDDVTCPAGQVCQDGDCVTDPNYDPCTGVTCAAGEVCDNGNCVTDPNACEACGTYNAQSDDGYMIVPGVIDTTFDANHVLSLPATFAETSGSYTLSVDLSGLSSALTAPIVVEGSYNASTKVFTVTDFVYSLYGSIPILVNGSVDFSTTNQADGTLTLADGPGSSLGIDGQINFAGTKQ